MKAQTGLLFSLRHLRTCGVAFLIGAPAGFGLAYLLPALGAQYVRFLQARTVSSLGTPAGVPLGFPHMAIIFLNNLVPVLIGFALPFLLANYAVHFSKDRGPSRLARSLGKVLARAQVKPAALEVYVTLSILAVAVSFFQGLFLIGLFPGYLMEAFGLRAFQLAVVYVLPHAPLEFLGIVLATSSALTLRDLLVASIESGGIEGARSVLGLWHSKKLGLSLLAVSVILLVAAFLEVFVSARLLSAVSG